MFSKCRLDGQDLFPMDDRYLLNIALFVKAFQNLSFETNGAP